MLFIGPVVYAQEASLRLEQANTLYRGGDFKNAVVAYEDILKNGYEHPALYYNLGNAYFKLGNIPAAITNYERAKRLSPRDEDINQNLRLANLRVVDKIEPLPQLFIQDWWDALLSLFASDGWAVFGIISIWIAVIAGVLFMLLRSGVLQRILFVIILISLIVTILSTVGVVQQRHREYNEQQAIVFSPSISIKSAPDAQSMDLFVLHEGVKVELLDHVGEWRKIRLADGKVGWLQSECVEII